MSSLSQEEHDSVVGQPAARRRAARKSRPNAADTMAEQIKKFWQAHDPSGSIFAEAKELARLIFRKRKRVVPQDLWITGAAESGEKQHDTAVVSEIHMLQQMKDTLELRHEYLKGAGRELNHVLKNEKERQEFLKFAKDRYHSDPEQKELQRRDVEDGGNKKMHAGKHSRWSMEMQRRCGDKTFWECVSFTGAFNLAALAKTLRTASPERDPAKLSIQKRRTRAARRARQRVRKAKSLKKRHQKGNGIRLTRQAMAMTKDLDNGLLMPSNSRWKKRAADAIERVEMPRTLLRPKSKAKSKLKSQASASPVEAVEAAARVAVDSKGSCLASDPQHQEFLTYLEEKCKTKESGYGRVKHKNGTHTEIGPHRGRLTRTTLDNILDDWNPPTWPDSIDDEAEEETMAHNGGSLRTAHDGGPSPISSGILDYLGRNRPET